MGGDGNYWCKTDDVITSIASGRIREIINVYCQSKELNKDVLSFILEYTVSDSYINAVASKDAQANLTQEDYRAMLLADYMLALEYCEKEFTYDYLSAKFAYDTSKAPYNQWKDLFGDEVFCFLFYEGYITAEYPKDPLTNKNDTTTILRFSYKIDRNMLENMDMNSAISFVYDIKTANEFDAILQYYYTGSWLSDDFKDDALLILFNENSGSFFVEGRVFVW